MGGSSFVRGLLAATLIVGTLSAAPPAAAQGFGAPVKSILGDASDSALDKLAEPGAFYADKAIRILLPGPLKKASKLLKYTDQAGLTGNLTKSLNDAAGLAAKEAKPIFRSAINDMTLEDGIGVVSKSDGATRYLQESAGDDLHAKVRPLVAAALGHVGAFDQLDRLGGASSLLSGAGLSRDGLTDSVTDQALKGIFKYIGTEEAKLRANPLDAGKKLLESIRK